MRIPPLRLDQPRPRSPENEADAKTRDFLKSITLHEDADVLVLNKPMGLAVQGGSGTTRHLDGMLEVLRDAQGQRPRLVHRLDKDTAGCLLVAKTRFAATALAASGMVYVTGLWRMRARGSLPASLEIASFAAGWAVLALALLSPIATLSESLFSLHMTQHELLMLVAAPLLAMGRPQVPMLFALPGRWRPSGHGVRVFRLASSPFTVFALHAIALWLWHRRTVRWREENGII